MPHLLFIHGFFMTSACFDRFRGRAAERGVETSAPGWPHLDRPVAELRSAPPPELDGVGVTQLVDRYAAAAAAVDGPLVLVGHSMGGLIAQLLLDRGIGQAAVAIASAPVRGVPLAPSLFAANLPVLARFGARTHPATRTRFARNFANTMPRDQIQAEFEAHMVPAPGRAVREVLLAPFNRLTQVEAGPHTPPLLLVGAGKDRAVPPTTVRSLHRWYARRGAAVDLLMYPELSHWLIAEPGWEAVADGVLDWAERAVRPAAVDRSAGSTHSDVDSSSAASTIAAVSTEPDA